MIYQDFDQNREDEIMSFLTKNFGFEVFTPGLLRTKPVYKPFIDYFKKVGSRVVIVAGTNGKGQTAHTIGSLLSLEKKSFALWTSPHILSIRERFLVSSNGDSEEVGYEALKLAMDEAWDVLQKDLKGIKVSFYEFLFLVFLIIAKKKKHIDYLILEVGLGGRLDAVNHFDADCACITSISRDHQSILGSRYDQILLEKIAVAREKRVLFTSFTLEYLNSLTQNYVQKHSVIWHPLPINRAGASSYFEENQRLAWETFHYLEPASRQTFESGMRQLPLYKGRREVMTFEGKSLIFVGAHNIDGVRRMLQSYQDSAQVLFPESLLVSFSGRPIGEVEVMLRSLVDFFKEKVSVTLTSFDHPKAMDAALIRGALEKVNKGMLNFVFDWKSELKNSQAKTVLVCGSYYFIGEVQRFIRS